MNREHAARPSASPAEVRAAFDYASDMCKRKGYKIIEGSYQC